LKLGVCTLVRPFDHRLLRDGGDSINSTQLPITYQQKGNQAMTFKGQFLTLSLLTAAFAVLSQLPAAAISINVNMDTSALIANPSAPFSLDFQFNDGGVLGNNTATVSNFTYSGGTATGSATSFGGATGNIGSSITFDNSDTFQELFQTFTPGTILSFDVDLTTNVDGVTPDAFVFSILDNTLANIPTTGLGNSLLLVNLDGINPSIFTSSGLGQFATVTTNVVPEPSTMAALGFGLVGLFARKKKQAK
jgi:hypothetical protein